MFSSKSQSGFSAVEALIIIVVVGIIGLVGYTVYNGQQNKTASPSTSQPASSDQPAVSNDVQSAPEISSTKDLDKAQAVLDQTDPVASNGNDTSQLDAQLADF